MKLLEDGKIVYSHQDEIFVAAFNKWLDYMIFSPAAVDRATLMLLVMKYVLNNKEIMKT